MCTVSFYKDKNRIVITSNRDESYKRLKSSDFKEHIINGKTLYFPQDPYSGGTWFVIDKKNTVIVLLNGGLIKHNKRKKYRMSRGLVLLQIASANDVLSEIETINLLEIEPFTLIIFYKEKLYHFFWDQHNKNLKELVVTTRYIWSSSTLYSPAIQQKKRISFNEFVKNTLHIDENKIYDFHLSQQKQGNIKTVSITQAIIKNEKLNYLYQPTEETAHCSGKDQG